MAKLETLKRIGPHRKGGLRSSSGGCSNTRRLRCVDCVADRKRWAVGGYLLGDGAVVDDEL